MSTTTRRIEALLREAGEAGDLVQAHICRVALGEDFSDTDHANADEDGYPDFSAVARGDELRALKAAVRMSQEDAWAECKRVLADAEVAQ